MAYGSVLGQSQSVLSPATAIKMGLEPTASADDAFDKLTGSVLQIENQLTNIQGEPIQIPSSQILNGVRMATGSYVGTGAYGSNNPNRLTFDFEPILFMVFGSANTSSLVSTGFALKGFGLMTSTNTSYNSTNAGGSLGYAPNIAFNGKTISWYTNNEKAYNQFNAQNITYNYIAFG